jgi:hypothetical protein
MGRFVRDLHDYFRWRKHGIEKCFNGDKWKMTSILVILTGVLMVWVGMNDMTTSFSNVVSGTNPSTDKKENTSKIPGKPGSSDPKVFPE